MIEETAIIKKIITGIATIKKIIANTITVPVLGFDIDAQAFFDAVVIAGGSLSDTEKDAVNVYILDAKNNTNSWWTDLSAWYPMVGSSAASTGVNAKTPGTFDITWVNTPTFSSNGVDFNGTNEYGRTGFIPSTGFPSNNDASIGYYSRENIDSGNITMGVNNASSTQRLFLTLKNSGSFTGIMFNQAGSQDINISSSDSRGEFVLSRTTSTNLKGYRNGVSLETQTGAHTGTRPTLEIYLGARNNNGSASLFTAYQTAGVFIADGLSTAQILAQYTAIQVMNTSLSRQA